MGDTCKNTPIGVAGCIKLARSIKMYMEMVGKSYADNPEQKSQSLLTIMELWTAMDEIAVELFPLLREYEPAFSTSIFDFLQLSRLVDMHRLHVVRHYLQARYEKAGSSGTSIFIDPIKGCFGERYYNESSESPKFHSLRTEIEDMAEVTRKKKMRQWTVLTADYERLVKTCAQSTCIYHTDSYGQPRHDKRDCVKCSTQHQLDNFRKIRVHEYPLPADEAEAKTVVGSQLLKNVRY